ncbi:MAG: hypothetical protein KDD11_02080 [Acidobacteria bacterium]|nr:hypothetical protein [Acidobacteriota bacterium]
MSAPAPASFFDYLKAAFFRRYPVPFLGAMPVNQMALGAFAVLGIANPGFWLLGAAAEITYLLSLAGSERFQKLLQGEHLQQTQQRSNRKLVDAIARLKPEARLRYAQLLEQAKGIADPAAAIEDDGPVKLQEVRSGSLSQLVWIFLRLLISRQALEETLERVDRPALEAEIQRLDERLQGETEETALVRSLKGTLEIQKKRLENLAKAEESRLVIDAELKRIERQVELIREETALTGRAEVLSDRLDSVSVTLNETNRWMEQNAEIFGGLGSEVWAVDPLGADPLSVDPMAAEVPAAAELEGAGHRVPPPLPPDAGRRRDRETR